MSHNLHWENYENLESGFDNWTEKFRWSEDQERYIPGWRAITITICKTDEAQEMHRRIQTQ